MPAPVLASTSTSPHDTRKQSASKSNAHPRTARALRRRGRTRAGGIDSDDEIERAAMSDDSDSGTQSILDSSGSEPESEAESDELRTGHSRVETPSTMQSLPAEVDTTSVDVVEVDPATLHDHAPSFLSSGIDWSDMVADESINGKAGLPVIDFADMHEHAAATSRQTSKSPPIQVQTSPQASNHVQGQENQEDVHDGADSVPSSSVRPVGSGRSSGQTARQAYQQRLQTDPSFVPTVGEFWGHDDRLLQKDLRSLSGWWRGRWQGRGRGRGVFQGAKSMRGHGRGGITGDSSYVRRVDENTPQPDLHTGTEELSAATRDIPLIDQAWTHDGFEEMKSRDSRRRATQQEHSEEPQTQRTIDANGVRGRRGSFIVGRGRGNFVHGRGGVVTSPGRRSRPNLLFPPHARSTSERPWFAMKPERTWTKQHEGFLHIDPALKPRFGQLPSFRVSLPGKDCIVVKCSVQPSQPYTRQRSGTQSEVVDQERNIAVKLPKWVKEAVVGEVLPESITTMEAPPTDNPMTATSSNVALSISNSTAGSSQPMDVGTSSPTPTSHIVPGPSHRAEISPLANFPPPLRAPSQTDLESQASHQNAEHESIHDQVIAQEVLPGPIPSTNNSSEEPLGEVSALQHPDGLQLPPLQTSFPPPNQPSPTYSSPYGFPASLPPGVALSQQGFAYEMATGRPVYLHPTPPPIPLYNPRPVAHPLSVQHSVPFVPGHVHHASSISPDFLPQPNTPPMNGFVDASTGVPLFSLPRQSSRVEIRAPSDPSEGRGKAERRHSNLRSAVSAEPFQPSQNGFKPYAQASEYFPENGALASGYEGDESRTAGDGSQMVPQQPVDSSMMGYAPFQQQYYYPDQYAYPPYVEMSQQGVQYDTYPSEPQQQHQATVYY